MQKSTKTTTIRRVQHKRQRTRKRKDKVSVMLLLQERAVQTTDTILNCKYQNTYTTRPMREWVLGDQPQAGQLQPGEQAPTTYDKKGEYWYNEGYEKLTKAEQLQRGVEWKYNTRELQKAIDDFTRGIHTNKM
eukprot:3163624-Amphidinium_carterae.1